MDDLTTTTDETLATTSATSPAPATAETGDQQNLTDLLDDELLVEEISIDGMCGVY